MANNIELLVKIGLDTSKKADLQLEIDKLGKSLEGLKVDIKFDKEAIKSLNEIAKMDFSKLTQSINGIKTDLKSISKEAKQTATITADQFKQAGKDIDAAFGHIGKNFQKAAKSGIQDTKQLKEAFKGLGATFNYDYKILKNGEAGTATKEINGVTVSYRNLQGQMEKVKMVKNQIDMGNGQLKSVFLPAGESKAIDNAMSKMAKLGEQTQKTLNTMKINGKITEDQFNKLSASIAKTGSVDGFDKLNQKIQRTVVSQKSLTDEARKSETAQTKQATAMATASESVTQKLIKLRAEGKITDQQFATLSDRISKIGHSQGFTLLNQRINETVIKQKQIVAGQKEQELAQIRLANNELKRKNLIFDIERALRNQASTINTMSANKLLNDVKQLNTTSQSFNQSISASRSSFRQLNAEASDLSRTNGGMVNSFKQAMEKFPIWMAASTLFYGVIRTAREFGSIIVDIDSKMTTLTKVMSDDTDFAGIFDQATEAAGRLGQSISAVLDSFAEFARQGFKGDELAGLADAGLVASNVGEITAQQASEYMTASLVQWKIDAADSMKIIDSLVY